MKWFVAFVIVVIVAVAGWFIFSNANNTATPQEASTTPTSTVAADIIPGVPNQTYTNSQLGFSIEYPSSSVATSSFSTGYLPLTQAPLVAFELPQSMFQGTNLSEAGVYIGATNSPAVLTDCSEPVQGETATSSVALGGNSFAVFTSTGVAAGNIYQETSYRTLQNGDCIEIVELLHSGDIGNYPAGSVQPFDQAEFSGILNGIVQTFQSGTAQ